MTSKLQMNALSSSSIIALFKNLSVPDLGPVDTHYFLAHFLGADFRVECQRDSVVQLKRAGGPFAVNSATTFPVRIEIAYHHYTETTTVVLSFNNNKVVEKRITRDCRKFCSVNMYNRIRNQYIVDVAVGLASLDLPVLLITIIADYVRIAQTNEPATEPKKLSLQIEWKIAKTIKHFQNKIEKH